MTGRPEGSGPTPDPAPGSVAGQESPFRRRTAVLLSSVVVVSLAAAVAFAIFSDDFIDISSSGANTYSRSALGHHGVVELLEKLDIPVLVSEHDSASKAGQGAVLVVAEPVILEDASPRAETLDTMLVQSSVTLVILPKWFGRSGTRKPQWVNKVDLLDIGEIAPVLDAIGVSATIRRSPGTFGPGAWQVAEFEDRDGMGMLAEGKLAQPLIDTPQLIETDALQPVIASSDGMLLGVGEIESGGELWVLSDPDVLSNHGLGRGNNALLAVQLIQVMREAASGTVVFDETLHGFRKEPSLWRALFEFPLALATIQALLAVVLLLWAATGRFGKPVAPPPPIEPGKAFLIESTATLMRFGHHADHALERYFHVSVLEVARALHAPHDLSDEARAAWLERVGRARGVGQSLGDLQRHVSETLASRGRTSEERAVRVAHEIYRWRKAMTRAT